MRGNHDLSAPFVITTTGERGCRYAAGYASRALGVDARFCRGWCAFAAESHRMSCSLPAGDEDRADADLNSGADQRKLSVNALTVFRALHW